MACRSAPFHLYNRQDLTGTAQGMASEQRRLAAILAADVVGYSRLMGRDEAGTLARLKTHRSRHLEPVLARRHGRLVKLTGDGVLAEFGSAVEAVSAAIEFQQAIAEANREEPEEKRIVFRIGLHLGDVIVDGDDLYGDGVNIAARLEGEAPPGGVLLSGSVHDAIAGRLACSFDEIGPLSLKNIERPVRALRVSWRTQDWPPAAAPATAGPSAAGPQLALPDRPSIAVLPFTNMSGDTEQEYFADGITEDIITALSRFRSLFVIARNSSFTYKGRPVDVRTVGRELAVRYVLEGSVRKAGNRVRITGQLVEAETGAHIWADRYDGELTDIFALQDSVSSGVVAAIEPRLLRAEIDRIGRKPTENPGAYECYLRGMASFYRWTPDSLNEALDLFHRAAALDPGYALAWAMEAYCHQQRKGRGLAIDLAHEASVAAGLSQRAVELESDDANVLTLVAYTLAHLVLDLSAGQRAVARALTLNRNLARAWEVSGWINVWSGSPDIAIEHFANGMRLSPLDPQLHIMQAGTATAHFMAGRDEEAISWLGGAKRRDWRGGPSLRIATASTAMAGHLEDARQLAELLRQTEPRLRVSNIETSLGPYRRAEDIERYKEGFRRAGMPE